jgi:hypothetical protein
VESRPGERVYADTCAILGIDESGDSTFLETTDGGSPTPPTFQARRHDVLGGLIHEYYPAAT